MSFLPTKGMEYVLVLSYLALLVPFWRILRRGRRPAPVPVTPATRVVGRGSWFRVPEGVFFHRGHSWAHPADDDLVTVGMDDFAYGLIGRPDGFLLPPSGTELHQGERAWSAQIDGHVFDVLSPVDGEVMEVNEAAVSQPALAAADPYDRGWLLKVKPRDALAALKNLLPHQVARAWLDDVEEHLSAQMGLPDGMVLQDGGLPVSGFARQLGGDRWHELAAEYLLTQSTSPRR